MNQRKVVIVAGFQGVNQNYDITTLGRGGSDTTAVALAARLKANHCYIFSDVDGVYTSDPRQVKIAKKIDTLSYEEMLDIAGEGAKVLHNRCVEVGEKFNIPIVAKSTFKDGEGTIINDKKIEGTMVKNIVKNDNILFVTAKSKTYSLELFNTIYKEFIINELNVKNLVNSSEETLDISFTIPKSKFNKFANLLETKLDMLDCTYTDISRISIIGSGIMSNNLILKKAMHIIEVNKLDILSMEINESRISIMFKYKVDDSIAEELHQHLIF